MKKILQKNAIAIIFALIAVCALVFLLVGKTKYANEVSKQDLAIKCQQLYDMKHVSLEKSRYKEQGKDSMIWSPKTRSCLAYYNVYQEIPKSYQFEVWDYTNDDLVLSYNSYESEKCIWRERIVSQQSLKYKLNSKLEGSGCDMVMMDEGVDLLTNFETAMADLGFKK